MGSPKDLWMVIEFGEVDIGDKVVVGEVELAGDEVVEACEVVKVEFL